MKHLIPYLQDAQKAADDLRHVRWPAGVTCPRCGSDVVASRDRGDHGLRRCNGPPCAERLGQQLALCTAWTHASLAQSQWKPLAWWLGLGVWPWKRNATAMAAAAALQERTAPRWLPLLDGGIDATDQRAPSRPREHPVAADEGDQRAGRQGRPRAVARGDRAPRQRGRPLRGRAPAATGRPPIWGVGHRRDQADQEAPAAHVSLAGLEPVRTATMPPLILAQVQGGARCCTDAYPSSHGPQAADDHRTVNHGAGAYARRDPDGAGVHGNTMAGLGSGRRHFLDRFQGISPRFLPLRVLRDEFLPTHKHVHWCQTCEAALRSIVSTTGDEWRRMAHQHRRIPLTLCYR
jgi:Transposase zinc-ribbon domain